MAANRRAFLGTMAAASVGALASRWPTVAGQTPPAVDARQLRERIESLSMFGRPEGGAFADGVSRVAYSQADVDGRRYVIDLMRAAKLTPRIDPAGNIYGRREGREPGLPPILFGS